MTMYPQVLFKNRHPKRIATLEEYRKSGGYEALTEALHSLSPGDVSQRVLDAGLRGRGGAGFPAGKKWSLVPDDASFPRYLVANTDEMEPGTFKDRVLVHADPHLIIEGMALAAYAVSARKGFIFVRPSYESAASILEREVGVARQAGFLGERIQGTDFSFDIVVHRSGGRYICGEGTAMLNAIQGKRPNPRQPPPYSTERGLWDKPTVVNNAETLANAPGILRNGPAWYKGLARSKGAAGTKLFCVSGRVNKPGCFELPLGTPLNEIIEEFAGGLPEGSEFKSCLPGGASTSYMSAEHYTAEMDFDTLKDIGHRLGTAAIMVFDQKTCLVAATLNLTEFFARESCGWCTPCREGFPYLRDLLHRIEYGQGEEEFIPLIRSMCQQMTNSYCAFALGGISPVQGLLDNFEDEVMAHIEQRRCPFRE
jgi:NADH-quinone oxidoreductase subunit F